MDNSLDNMMLQIRRVMREESAAQLAEFQHLLHAHQEAIDQSVAIKLQELQLFNEDRFNAMDSVLSVLAATTSSSQSTRNSAVSQLSHHSHFSPGASPRADADAWNVESTEPTWASLSTGGAAQPQNAFSAPLLLVSNAETAKICLLCRRPFATNKCVSMSTYRIFLMILTPLQAQQRAHDQLPASYIKL